jgi:leucyl/phenylalanyl-tRNA---protein transferase
VTGRVYIPAVGPGPAFPEPSEMRLTCDGLVALGGDLRPSTLVEAYRKGLFPWEDIDPVPWFSPDPRCVLEPSAFRASRSLLKLARSGRYRVTADACFESVMRACAGAARPGQRGTWIGERMVGAYSALHRIGVGHSVEVWEGDRLVGGLYGLAIGRAFFGESMFSAAPSASKLALMRLSERLDAWGFHFIDCQQETPHLLALGATTLPRRSYLRLLERALDGPDAWNPKKRRPIRLG